MTSTPFLLQMPPPVPFFGPGKGAGSVCLINTLSRIIFSDCRLNQGTNGTPTCISTSLRTSSLMLAKCGRLITCQQLSLALPPTLSSGRLMVTNHILLSQISHRARTRHEVRKRNSSEVLYRLCLLYDCSIYASHGKRPAVLAGSLLSLERYIKASLGTREEPTVGQYIGIRGTHQAELRTNQRTTVQSETTAVKVCRCWNLLHLSAE